MLNYCHYFHISHSCVRSVATHGYAWLYYADPYNCSSYYVCRANVAYHYVIIMDTSLYFNTALMTAAII